MSPIPLLLQPITLSSPLRFGETERLRSRYQNELTGIKKTEPLAVRLHMALSKRQGLDDTISLHFQDEYLCKSKEINPLYATEQTPPHAESMMAVIAEHKQLAQKMEKQLPQSQLLQKELLPRIAKWDRHLLPYLERLKPYQDAVQNIYQAILKQLPTWQPQQSGQLLIDVDGVSLYEFWPGFLSAPRLLDGSNLKGETLLAQKTFDEKPYSRFPIPEIKDVITKLNKLGIGYRFVTSRQKADAQGTRQNLEDFGLWGNACKGIDFTKDKWRFMKQVADSGYQLNGEPVLGSVGNSKGDMLNHPQLDFKLPNMPPCELNISAPPS